MVTLSFFPEWSVSAHRNRRRGKATIPFTANVNLEIGPDLTQHWRVPTDPFTATLVQDVDLDPDKENYVASIMTRLYTLKKVTMNRKNLHLTTCGHLNLFIHQTDAGLHL
ncbi:MAG: hypothetical protein Ct9H300mP22_3410 [Gammaproteobacteria bacterium]|nr:MAG: hypothetical protein Ct9H300mP22_3410 [Gammaproteobacteria bacterium]